MVNADSARQANEISIPLRYNLEGRPRQGWQERYSISIPLRYNLENIKVCIHPNTALHFNSTKVQFRAVKLDRKYHINKGFEKRFR